ncbi:phosphoesterase [Bacteroides sp. 224]|uniref:metallophosphoesterase family protein n=1 Tax=Bacteroides sp. 224 TaxID=2302936 RepID=UPI0013D13E5C|nr:phosphoesterase [Bacteroides sp. 224]NDV63926.1 phosphoesterase [Bacteroides sp. 224]
MVENKVPCALLINDVHVSKDNIPEFHKNWDEALSICQKEGIPDLIVGGDLWQSRSSQTLSTLLAVRDAFMRSNKLGIDVTLSEGNHCKVDQESIYGYSHVFDQYPGVFAIDDVKCYDYDDVSLYIMSYFPENGSCIDRLNCIIANLDKSRYNILYAHQGINGALAVATDNELPTKAFKDFDKVLVGHYHNRCKIKNTNIEYIGSSRQHNFGEDEEKGYTLLYSDGSTKFIKNKVNIRYKVFELTSKQINDAMLAEVTVLAKNPQYLIKTKINCSAAEASLVDKSKLLSAGVSKIDIVTDDVLPGVCQQATLESKFDKLGIKKEYTSFCEQKEFLNVELGLKYLDKIN